MIKLMLLFLFSVSVVQAADLSGQFKGTGKYRSMDGSLIAECSSVSFEIIQTKTEFKIEEIQFICADQTQQGDPVELEIRGNLLFSGDTQMGKISGDQVNLKFADPDQDIAFQLNLKLSNQNQLSFEEKYSDFAAKQGVWIQGDLKR